MATMNDVVEMLLERLTNIEKKLETLERNIINGKDKVLEITVNNRVIPVHNDTVHNKYDGRLVEIHTVNDDDGVLPTFVKQAVLGQHGEPDTDEFIRIARSILHEKYDEFIKWVDDCFGISCDNDDGARNGNLKNWLPGHPTDKRSIYGYILSYFCTRKGLADYIDLDYGTKFFFDDIRYNGITLTTYSFLMEKVIPLCKLIGIKNITGIYIRSYGTRHHRKIEDILFFGSNLPTFREDRKIIRKICMRLLEDYTLGVENHEMPQLQRVGAHHEERLREIIRLLAD
jgi:hypothetical protein